MQDEQELQQEPSLELPDIQPAPAAPGGGREGSWPTPGSPEQQQGAQQAQQAPEGSRVGSNVLGPANGQQQVGVPQPGTPAAAQGSGLLRGGSGLLVLLPGQGAARPRLLQAGCR
jgi:hypothetical protein